MSYVSSARRARDPAAPLGFRIRALRSCVQHFGPLGYHATLRHLADEVGPLDQPDNITAAIELLDASREAWLAQVDMFAAQRRAAKARRQRAVPNGRLESFRYLGWPGDDTDRTPLSERFLAQYGMLAIVPDLEILRRRLLVAQRAFARDAKPPQIEHGSTKVTLVVAGLIAAVGLGIGVIARPGALFWVPFLAAAVTSVIGVQLAPSRESKDDRDRWTRDRELAAHQLARLTARIEELELSRAARPARG